MVSDGKRRKFVCVLCGITAIGYGHNPEPLVEYEVGRCCDECNTNRVIPARLKRMAERMEQDGQTPR